MMKLSSILVLALLLAGVCVHSNNIILLDSTTFSQARHQFPNLLVFFNDQTCQQCKAAAEIYYTLSVLCSQQPSSQQKPPLFSLTSSLQFAQINLLNHEDLFQGQGVEAVPEFLLYLKGSQKPFRFPLISLTYQNLWMMANWIKRVTQKYVATFDSLNSLNQTRLKSQKYVIVDCKEADLLKKIKESEDFLLNLDINYICLTDSHLRNGHILLKENEYTFKLAQCTEEQEEERNWDECQSMIRNFRFKGIVHWSDDIIDNLYNKNYSVVVVITNNQSVSHQHIRELTEVKKDLELKQRDRNQILLPVFAVADIHYDLQSTIRLKKFIGGFDLKGWPYPYPLLAFLWCNSKGEIVKYIYQQKYNDSLKSTLSISQWIQQAISHNLPPDYRSLNYSKQIQFLENKEERAVYKIFLSELIELLGKYKSATSTQRKPIIFLYVLWRSSWPMQLILSRIKRWWGSVTYDALFYNFDLLDNDLPPGVTIQELPALVVYFSDGAVSVVEGIESEEQIKGVVGQVFKGTKASR